MNTIQKLKAGLIALYDDAKQDKINLAKYIFLSQRMIPLKKTKSFLHNNLFTNFLDTCYMKNHHEYNNEKFVLEEYVKLRNGFMLKKVLGLKLNFNICEPGKIQNLVNKCKD